ncbi:MAG TPA: HD domain-containing protein [Planctomycetota bacterium]|nr:HD domain-containing protein [Planctomycetota bacterium]
MTLAAFVPRDRAGLLAWCEDRPRLAAVLRDVRARASTDPAHDLSHFLRVALWTLRLGAPPSAPELCVAAGLLHDVVNVPKDHPLRTQASALCAEAARGILARAGFSSAETEEVADAILTHSYSRGETPRSPLGDALQDADRLEALGVLGLMRCIATGVRMDAAFFDPEDPWAERREPDDKAYSLDHLFVKLLRLPSTMRTAAGRREAERRAATLRDLAVRLGDEMGAAPPPRRLTP